MGARLLVVGCSQHAISLSTEDLPSVGATHQQVIERMAKKKRLLQITPTDGNKAPPHDLVIMGNLNGKVGDDNTGRQQAMSRYGYETIHMH